jgi:hypothetical protein
MRRWLTRGREYQHQAGGGAGSPFRASHAVCSIRGG